MTQKSQEFFGFEGLRSPTASNPALARIFSDIQKRFGEKSTRTSLSFIESTLP